MLNIQACSKEQLLGQCPTSTDSSLFGGMLYENAIVHEALPYSFTELRGLLHALKCVSETGPYMSVVNQMQLDYMTAAAGIYDCCRHPRPWIGMLL